MAILEANNLTHVYGQGSAAVKASAAAAVMPFALKARANPSATKMMPTFSTVL